MAGLLMASAMYTPYALRELGADDAAIGLFTVVFRVSTTLCSVAVGILADRVGHTRVFLIAYGASAAASVLALAPTGLGPFTLVFLVLGLSEAAVNVSGLAVWLEFASEHDRPTYVALGGLVIAPFVFGAPLLGGALADAFGYGPVFVAGTLLSLLGLLLTLRVPGSTHYCGSRR